MSDSAQAQTNFRRFWVVPPYARHAAGPADFEPLPALVAEAEGLPDGALFLFDRKKREFNTSDPRDSRRTVLYCTFEECRHAMMTQWLDGLRDATNVARHAASVIEHLRTIPTQSFPDVLPEVPKTQVTQEEKAQEKEATGPKVTTEKRSTAKKN